MKPNAKKDGVNKMIYELVRLMEKELGSALPIETAHRLEAALSEQFGGERVYVPKLPKLVSRVKIAAIGTGLASAALAQELGITVRQVRRIQTGK